MKKRRIYLRVDRKISADGYQPTCAWVDVVGDLTVAYHRPVHPALRDLWVVSDPSTGYGLCALGRSTREDCRALIVHDYERYEKWYQSDLFEKAREDLEEYLK